MQDIGIASAVAFADPIGFNWVELELASDWLRMDEIAAILSKAMGIDLAAPNLTVDEAIAQGMMPALVVGQEWTNEMPAPARPDAHGFELPTTDFRSWAEEKLTPKLNQG